MRRGVILLFFISLSLYLHAQLEFVATSNLSSVPVGQSFSVKYILSGADAEIFSKPSFSGFRILGEQSYSSGGGFRIVVNNQVVNEGLEESTWIFTLVASNPGNYVINPAKIKSNGKWYASNSLNIIVTAGGSAVNSSNSSSNLDNSNQQASNNEAYLSATPDKTTAYVGEPIIVTYRIYTKVDITQYGVDKVASMDGFWLEELLDQQVEAKTWEEVIDGENYLVGEIRKIALYPQRSGQLKVPPLEVEALLKIATQAEVDLLDFFDQFLQDPFGSDPFSNFTVKTEKRTLKSTTFTVNIIALPEEEQPESFTNAVGVFTAELEIDEEKCLTGDGVILSLKISGNGNLMLIDALEPDIPSGIKIYDPEIIDDFKKSSNGISGTRTIEYLLVPEIPGEYSLGPYKFSFFNPETEEYEEIEFPVINLKVGKGSGSKRISSEDVAEDDIRHISEKLSYSFIKYDRFVFSLLFWILFALAWIGFLLVLFFMRKKLKLRSNIKEFKNSMALRYACRRLKLASTYLKKGDDVKFFQELSHAMWLYITDKFALPISELSINNVLEVLLSNGIDKDLALRFTEILSACDFARFAPAHKKGNMHELYKKASELIVDVQTRAK